MGYNESVERLFALLHELESEYKLNARLMARRFFKRCHFVGGLAERAQLEIDKALAPRFSVMDYISPDEMKISAILADLLDPHGSHGQQTLFLESFLQRVSAQLTEDTRLELYRLPETGVYREAATYKIENVRRRIDIVMVNPGWVVGIENKPWANEQEDQLKDYRTHLEKAYPGKPVHIVYLPGDCSRAKSDKTDGKTTITIGYNWSEVCCGAESKAFHLSDWLEETILDCNVDKIRHFLKDFLQWINREFINHSPESGHRKII
ncbi:MAG: PD-(D/E)XK nuclease family protein [Deltaproteobacteria bacterium]|jgi:hypothetical protein|nr:PD-(D/E)XK nuclease family protein [Deltaproteobacteria bacterium]